MSDLRTKLARAVSPELAAVLPPRQSDALIDRWSGTRGVDFGNPWDMEPLPEAEYKAPAREPRWESRRDKVWPSEAFWDEYGSKDHGWQSRIGQAQAAASGAVNALGFGLPRAALRRFASDAAADLDAIHHSAGHAGLVGELAATVANPLNKVFRAGGDALAARGYGMPVQMGADAATAGAASLAPDLVDPYSYSPGMVAARFAAPTAAAMRYVSPSLAPGMMKRTVTGAAVGATTQAPGAIIGGTHADFMTIPIGAAFGGLTTAGQRPGAKAGPYQGVGDRLENTISMATLPAVGLQGLSAAHSFGTSPDDPNGKGVRDKIRKASPELHYPPGGQP